ncbi:ankyrin repeat domain-containing protein [Hydrogenophaga sp.]|uniref:ankyrin repeat domain-containing protein n=1 Tax=Hydrogenophaga sp. TaxID=1904254 RepID=UPI0025BC717D|nr:ankyrin repeat domain-containing protein [Hydrogenophaga sp.]
MSARAQSYDDFFAAIKRDDIDTVQRLASRGFDLNTLDPSGQHPLYLAIRDEAPKVSTYLVRQPSVKVEVRNAKGESPLMMAALKARLDLIEALIARGAEVNKPGWAPLHYAATNPGEQSLPVARLLLERYAFIDAQSPNGTTPLMMAAHYGNKAVVKLLLDEGADTAMKNEQGLSAIDFAHRAGRGDVAELIAAAIRQRQSTGKW